MKQEIAVIGGHPDPSRERNAHALATAYEHAIGVANRRAWLEELRRFGRDGR